MLSPRVCPRSSRTPRLQPRRARRSLALQPPRLRSHAARPRLPRSGQQRRARGLRDAPRSSGLLEPPTSGEVTIEGEAASQLPERRRTEIRRNALGFVYQFHHLLPEFTAEENVAMPRRISGASREEAAAEAKRLLTLVGLGERLDHRPAQLSGGEQQRVAMARALANRPRVLLADEPTGNLDPRTADGVFDMLIGLVRSEGLSALIATHNHDLSVKMDRTLLLDKGVLVERAPS